MVAPYTQKWAGCSSWCPGVLQLCGCSNVIAASKPCHRIITGPVIFLHCTWGLYNCIVVFVILRDTQTYWASFFYFNLIQSLVFVLFVRKAMTLARCLMRWSMFSLRCYWLSYRWMNLTLTLVQASRNVGRSFMEPLWKSSSALRSSLGYSIHSAPQTLVT